MKTIIDNRDTVYTIDMYQTFTGESITDEYIDEYNEENDKEFTYDDFDFDFDIEKIHMSLAEASIEYIKNNIDVVNDIELVDISRPKYYNYTTDSYRMNVDYDIAKVNEYINDSHDDYIEYIDGSSQEDDNYMRLCFYIDNHFENEDYYYYMFERSDMAYYKNMTSKL